MTEFKAGDKVTIKDDPGSKWDGLRAVISEVGAGSYGHLICMDEGDVRPDGYTSEPFTWRNLELRAVEGETSVETDAGTALREEIATLRQQVRDATSEKHEVTREFEAFKEKVVEVASKYAIKNDWCEEVNRALEEMGLDATTERRIHISGYVTVTVPLCSSDNDINAEVYINGDSMDMYAMEVGYDDEM